MSSHLDTIVELQRCLDDLETAERQIAGVPEWMETLHEEHSERLAEIESFEQAAEEASAARRKAEHASAEAEARLKKFQEQVSAVRTQREYAAVLQEIDTVKTEIKELEDRALEELERYDEAQEKLAEKREAFAELDSKYSQALAKWEEEKPAVEQQAETLRSRIAELKAQLPKNLLALFHRIRERHGGDAIAPVRSASGSSGDQLWHCTACNYRVRLQVVSQIRRGVLVQCDGCKRILSVDEPSG